MPRSPDHLPADPDLLRDLQRADGLSVEALRAGAAWVSRPPPPETWRRLLDPLALLLGISLIVAAVVYLVGFNWEGLGRLSRVAVGMAAVLITGGGALVVGTDKLAGKALATAAIPVLMAALSAVALAYPTDGEPWVQIGRAHV